MSCSMKISFRFLHTSRFCFRNVVIRRPVKVLNVPSTEYPIPTDPKETAVTTKDILNRDVPAVIDKPEENVIPYEKLKVNDGRFT